MVFCHRTEHHLDSQSKFQGNLRLDSEDAATDFEEQLGEPNLLGLEHHASDHEIAGTPGCPSHGVQGWSRFWKPEDDSDRKKTSRNVVWKLDVHH
jgi:hypothetical protein